MKIVRVGALCSVLAFSMAAVTLGACSSGSSGKTVKVTESDYKIVPEQASVSTGKVTFKVHNTGTFVHELVVVAFADAGALPLKPDGEVDEDAVPEAKRLGEVEDIAPNATKDVTFTLPAGTYVLFCNRLDGTTSHFKKGMHAVFTVTA